MRRKTLWSVESAFDPIIKIQDVEVDQETRIVTAEIRVA